VDSEDRAELPDRTWAEVDIGAIRSNAHALIAASGGRAELLAVVKADAYGHGSARVSSALRGIAAIFGVACVGEALALDAGDTPILLLSPCIPAEREEAIARCLIVTVSSAAEARAFASVGPCRVNFKVDTGMGRIGCWHENAIAELKEIARLPGMTIHSISTHLPSADDDPAFTADQLRLWARLRENLSLLAPAARFHVFNSAACFHFPAGEGDFVRGGLALYGYGACGEGAHSLRAALTWKARVLLVREVAGGRTVSYGRTYVTKAPTRLATLAVGYADGYPIQASGRGAEVILHGVRCPVVGRITMDQIIVDVGRVPSVRAGDAAIVLGEAAGECISADHLAALAGSIPWQILTGIGPRVRRVTVNSEASAMEAGSM
jgi:alanine racemase